MSKSGRIGTAAETLVVTVAQRNGFPYAKRVRLKGAKDCGDVHLGDGLDTIIEVKGGKQCTKLSPAKMNGWLSETREEATNSGAQIAFLVTQRAGYGLVNGERWLAHVPNEYWGALTGEIILEDYMTTELGYVLNLVKEYHYGK